MKQMFLLLNHDITDMQRQDADRMGVRCVVPLPPELQAAWVNIPADAPGIAPLLQPICEWLMKSAAPGDFVLIQGDFGACWLLVNFSFQLKLIPVYSTTERKALEMMQKDGSIQTVRQFKHIIFRKYGE